MTSIEEHKNKIREYLEEIEDAIDQGAEKKPATIGFHCSACALQLLEVYLRVTNKIPIGKILKHDWFKKPHSYQKVEPLIDKKLPLDFPKKQEIYDLIYTLEEERTSLVYGKPEKEQVKKVLSTFSNLKELLVNLLKNENQSV